jgi:hypothetical protein
MENNMKELISGIIVFVVFNAIGIYFLTKALKLRSKRIQAMRWPTTTATILDSQMTEDPSRNAMGNISVLYVISVNYEYTIAGKLYQGDRVSIGKPAFNYITASNISAQFAVGNHVPVSYNPNDPGDSVLAPKTTVGMLSWIPGAFFMLAGTVVGFISIFF